MIARHRIEELNLTQLWPLVMGRRLLFTSESQQPSDVSLRTSQLSDLSAMCSSVEVGRRQLSHMSCMSSVER